MAGDELAREPDLTRSELERMLLRLCRRHRLPLPEVNASVDVRGVGGPDASYEVDFLWRGLWLIVETDGFEYHGHRAAFEADRERDARLQAQGYAVLRFTFRQVSDSPARVAVTLKDAMRQQYGRIRPGRLDA